jgi:hypothetical protein
MSTAIVPWEAKELVTLPANARPKDIVKHATQLTPRDIKQVLDAFKAGSYEMVSTFVWQRAVGALRRQLALLGADFIGEMLGRPDITESSLIEQKVSDFEALRLAQDLGMISSTEALRLRHSLETLVHFHESDDSEGMTPGEAETCLRACVQAVLGRPKVEVAGKFAEFRQALEQEDFASHDAEMQALDVAPYFYQRTTLAILLARIRRADGAQLEHVLANTNVVLPIIWPKLRTPEKWQAGSTYAEVHAAGRVTAASGLKRALMRVKGFDFVPENLRSRTFAEAASALVQAHEGWNNFQSEGAPAAALASLGTVIPPAALHICISAALSSYLGNAYGISFAAEPHVTSVLDSLHEDRWRYYLEQCLVGDRRILEKLSEDRPLQRWIALCDQHNLTRLGTFSGDLAKLMVATGRRDAASCKSIALRMASQAA